MRTSLWTITVASLSLSASLAQEFERPTLIMAGGQPIDVEVGHSAPFVGDIDGDGLKDLLVGQYGEGRLRIYANQGTNKEPTFADHRWLEADGEVARIWTN